MIGLTRHAVRIARHAAQLVLLYNPGRTDFDERRGVSVNPRRGGTALKWSGKSIPIYGEVANFPGSRISLLTDEEVKRLIHRGRRPDGPTDEMTVGRGGSGSVCGFNGGAQQLILFSGPSSEADFDALLKLYRHDKETRHPVSGIGDRAYIMYPAPQNQYQRPTAFLVCAFSTTQVR